MAIPFEFFTLGTGVVFDQKASPNAFVSIGIPLYSRENVAVVRNSHSRFSCSLKEVAADSSKSLVAKDLFQDPPSYEDAVVDLNTKRENCDPCPTCPENKCPLTAQQIADINSGAPLFISKDRWSPHEIERNRDYIRPGQGYNLKTIPGKWLPKWVYTETDGGWVTNEHHRSWYNPPITQKEDKKESE